MSSNTRATITRLLAGLDDVVTQLCAKGGFVVWFQTKLVERLNALASEAGYRPLVVLDDKPATPDMTFEFTQPGETVKQLRRALVLDPCDDTARTAIYLGAVLARADGQKVSVSMRLFPGAAHEVAAALRRWVTYLRGELGALGLEAAPARSETAPTGTTPVSLKRSTERGEGRIKLIAALTKHHQYADGSCLNLEPIGNNKLAEDAGVSPSTASAFFNDEFEGHTKYKALCRDSGKLIASLKLLNNEFAPHDLYGRRPAGEDDRDDE